MNTGGRAEGESCARAVLAQAMRRACGCGSEDSGISDCVSDSRSAPGPLTHSWGQDMFSMNPCWRLLVLLSEAVLNWFHYFAGIDAKLARLFFLDSDVSSL